jgi:hypothetical protein
MGIASKIDISDEMTGIHENGPTRSTEERSAVVNKIAVRIRYGPRFGGLTMLADRGPTAIENRRKCNIASSAGISDQGKCCSLTAALGGQVAARDIANV